MICRKFSFLFDAFVRKIPLQKIHSGSGFKCMTTLADCPPMSLVLVCWHSRKWQGGDFRCQLPCEYQVDGAWKLQRHQNQKQGCIRCFWNLDCLETDCLNRGLVLHCGYCGKNVGREDKLRSHLKNRLCPSQYPCSACPQKFPSLKFLKKHRSDYHKKWSCTMSWLAVKYTTFMCILC